jgi:hypothetical protein
VIDPTVDFLAELATSGTVVAAVGSTHLPRTTRRDHPYPRSSGHALAAYAKQPPSATDLPMPISILKAAT